MIMLDCDGCELHPGDCAHLKQRGGVWIRVWVRAVREQTYYSRRRGIKRVVECLVDNGEKWDADLDGHTATYVAWTSKSAWLRKWNGVMGESPDIAKIRELEAEVKQLREAADELWYTINSVVYEEPCPKCGEEPDVVRKWLYDGDRVSCVCGHEGKIIKDYESATFEWDTVSDD